MTEQAKHTAGRSWQYLDTGEIFPADEEDFDSDHVIAGLFTPDDEIGNLIAAAPDLLRVARIFEATLPHLGASERSTHHLLTEVRAAIAKAEGR